jgi:aminoglycoside 6'-N-acetyltransferase
VELTGSKVRLRPITTDDVDTLTRLFGEPEVAPRWPDYDRERIEREYLNERGDDDTTAYVIEIDNEVAGLIQCYEEPDPEYRSASIDIAVSTKWHGTGVAVDALRTLARDLIERRGHHHLTIDPAADNARAIACYSKVGFRPVGVLRQNERGADGTFHDALMMDMLADELR